MQTLLPLTGVTTAAEAEAAGSAGADFVCDSVADLLLQ